MNSGRYRHRVTIQEKVVTKDAVGGILETWGTAFTRYAKIRPLTSREVFEADQLQTRQSHAIDFRFSSVVSTQHRVAFKARIFLIKSVSNPDERQQVTLLGCMEEGI